MQVGDPLERDFVGQRPPLVGIRCGDVPFASVELGALRVRDPREHGGAGRRSY